MSFCRVAVALHVSACSAPLPDIPEDTSTAGLSITTGERLDEAPSVLRLHLSPEAAVWPRRPRLFEGSLSQYQLGRVRQGEVPQTLALLEVPTHTWKEEDGLALAALRPLAEGVHTLTASGSAWSAQIRVQPPSEGIAKRLWPPPDLESATRMWLYCTAEPLRDDLPTTASLAPDGAEATVFSFDARRRCLSIEVSEPLRAGSRMLPPPKVGPVWLDPSPIEVGAPAQADVLQCSAGEVRIGPGCGTVADDRIVVSAPSAEMLWRFRLLPPTWEKVIASSGGARFAVTGLPPLSTLDLQLATWDLAGAHRVVDLRVSTSSAQPHVVINEVLANATGPEPAQEWVELYNDGVEPVDLDGWVLADAGGSARLPARRLSAGVFALVVREDYATTGTDVAPPPHAGLLRVPAIGRAGLSNAGERLVLYDSRGQLVSSFPAIMANRPGVSVARKKPSDPDEELRNFGLHADPGASPGAPNVVTEGAGS